MFPLCSLIGLLVVAAITSAAPTNSPTSNSSAPLSADPAALAAIHTALIADGIIPNVTADFTPIGALAVSYSNNTAISKPGQQIVIRATTKRPTFSFISTDGSFSTTDRFTLIMADPDAPSRANPTANGIRHMLATNIILTPSPADSSLFTITNSSAATSDYLPPAPPVGSGFHRYTFLLYPGTPSAAALAIVGNSSRAGFNPAVFAASSGLGSPIAVTFMNVQAANSTRKSKDKSNAASRSFRFAKPW